MTGKVAIQTTVPRKIAQPSPSTTTRESPGRSRALMPAKKSDMARSTTQSTYLPARSTFRFDDRGLGIALGRERVRLRLRGRLYWGITNGVSGAFGFFSGRVASHASTAGLNSGRKRWK